MKASTEVKMTRDDAETMGRAEGVKWQSYYMTFSIPFPLNQSTLRSFSHLPSGPALSKLNYDQDLDAHHSHRFSAA